MAVFLLWRIPSFALMTLRQAQARLQGGDNRPGGDPAAASIAAVAVPSVVVNYGYEVMWKRPKLTK